MEPSVRDLGIRPSTAALALQWWLRPAERAVHETSASAVIHLRLLAVPALVLGNSAPLALERKDAALLALLALDGPLPRARAAALLWPDAEPQKARNSLRQRLFRLRRSAGCDVVVEDSALALADSIDHDLAGLPARLASDPSAAAGELLGAFGYEDCEEFDDWVRSARERIRVLRRDAVAAAAAREEAGGHVARRAVVALSLAAAAADTGTTAGRHLAGPAGAAGHAGAQSGAGGLRREEVVRVLINEGAQHYNRINSARASFIRLVFQLT
jgi:hypothetical protein